MVLNNAIEPVEGLVVDTVSSGIAFRNHTVPQDIALGAEWIEDLLWIEPETACADLNVSVEFRIPLTNGYSSDLANISIVDDGGFANLIPEYPHVNVTNSQASLPSISRGVPILTNLLLWFRQQRSKLMITCRTIRT